MNVDTVSCNRKIYHGYSRIQITALRSWCEYSIDVTTEHPKRSFEYPVIFNAP